MEIDGLLDRITVDPGKCGGRPCVRGTRIEVAIILDALAEGLTTEQITEHFRGLQADDVRAAMAYGAELARENIWKATAS